MVNRLLAVIIVVLHTSLFAKLLKIPQYPLILDADFPAGSHVRKQANFWFHVFYALDDEDIIFHDPVVPDLIYSQCHIGSIEMKNWGDVARTQLQVLQDSLREKMGLEEFNSDTQNEVKDGFPFYWTKQQKLQAIDRIRFQRGLRRQFQLGLNRSYRYLPLIDSILLAHSLPSRLRFLPHLESSFFIHAYSSVGAAGMWQLMPSVAKQSLQINRYTDQRLEPLASTRVAAKLMKSNYARLQTWPLAVTAYNHGAGGLVRAQRILQSSDFDILASDYESPRFGFASRNFYAEFLVVSTLGILADSLYPQHQRYLPISTLSFSLKDSTKLSTVLEKYTWPRDTFQELNPSITPLAYTKNAKLSSGTRLNFLSHQITPQLLSSIPLQPLGTEAELHIALLQKKSEIKIETAVIPEPFNWLNNRSSLLSEQKVTLYLEESGDLNLSQSQQKIDGLPLYRLKNGRVNLIPRPEIEVLPIFTSSQPCLQIPWWDWFENIDEKNDSLATHDICLINSPSKGFYRKG